MCQVFHRVTSRFQPGQRSNHSPATVLSVCQPATWQMIAWTRLPDMTWTDYCQSAEKKSHHVDEITATKAAAYKSTAVVILPQRD